MHSTKWSIGELADSRDDRGVGVGHLREQLHRLAHFTMRAALVAIDRLEYPLPFHVAPEARLKLHRRAVFELHEPDRVVVRVAGHSLAREEVGQELVVVWQ